MTATRDETGRHGHAAALGAAGWLGLAAAPTFAVMALLTCVPNEGTDMMCSTAHGASLLSGMVPMYVLMSAFHSAPWLKLISSRRGGRHRCAVTNQPAPARYGEGICPETTTAQAAMPMSLKGILFSHRGPRGAARTEQSIR